MIPRPSVSPPSALRALLLAALALCAAALVACGGGDDGDGRTVQTPATTAEAQATETKAQRLNPGDRKAAVGSVSVCGALSEMRRLRPALRRFDGVSQRLQASTLGFPDGEDRPLEAFEARQRAESRDCDVFVAERADQVAGLAADGGLFDISPAAKDWVAAPDAAPLAPVGDAGRVFGLPVRADSAGGVLVVSVNARNPGGALELVRALADARIATD